MNAPTGPTGPTGPGSILPFASGSPVEISSNAEGSPAVAGIIGFGNQGANPVEASGEIILEDTPGQSVYCAFQMPRDGIISDFNAFFSLTEILNITGTAGAIIANIYSAGITDTVFTPLAVLSLTPELSAGNYPVGSAFSGDMSELGSVEKGSRILIAFTLETSGEDPDAVVTGYAGAGLCIS